MNRKKSLALIVIVSAAAGLFTLHNASAPMLKIDEVTQTATAAFISYPTQLPTPTLTFEGCAFIWAYHDAPGRLTEALSTAIQAIDPQATANASLFGEDCIYGDGHATFSTIETDFYVRMPVEDLMDEEKLGNQIRVVMDMISQIPREEIPGIDGFVEIQFFTGSSEKLIVRVPIGQYRNEGQGKSGPELLRMFLLPEEIPAPT